MSYIPKTISEVVLEFINQTTFLPAIQREYVWEPEGIEKALRFDHGQISHQLFPILENPGGEERSGSGFVGYLREKIHELLRRESRRPNFRRTDYGRVFTQSVEQFR